MINWNDMMMWQERHKDYVREATRERLVREAKAGYSKGLPFLAWARAWLKRYPATHAHKSHRTLAGPRRV